MLISTCKPDATGSYFGQAWIYNLARIRENQEKEHAFRGLCYVIRENPRVSE